MIEALQRMLLAARGFLHEMLLWVEGFAATPYGTWALFLIAFAESSFFPIPPDVLLIALCIGEPERSLWFALVCSVGSVLGGVAGYAIGLWGGRPLLLRLFSRRRIDAVAAYFDRWNAWAVGIAGLTPVPYKVFTISGGAFVINFRIFLVASLVSRSLRFFVIAVLMQVYGRPIRAFIEEYLGWLFLAFVALLVGGFWLAGRGARRCRRPPAVRMGYPRRCGGETMTADPHQHEHRAYRLHGRVQGVGFRAFIRRQARDLGLSGWARNEPDGTVAIEVSGPPGDLDSFEDRIRRGPPAGRVESVDRKRLGSPPGTDGFEIRF